MSEHSRDRATDNPGGMECQECGCIFVGAPEHHLCGLCNMKALARETLRLGNRFFATKDHPEWHMLHHMVGLSWLNLEDEDTGVTRFWLTSMGKSFAEADARARELASALTTLLASVQSVLAELGPGQSLRPAGAGKTNILASDANMAERVLFNMEQPK